MNGYSKCRGSLYATNEFCEFMKEGKLSEFIDGFELKFIAHTPQNGSGLIIMKAINVNYF